MTDIAPVMPEVNFGTDPVEDLHERMAELHAEGRRVVPVRYIDGIAWLILKYDDLSEAFSDDVKLPSAPGYERISMPSMGRTMQAMRGEEHRINRALVAGAFQPAVIRKAATEMLVPFANSLIDGFADRRRIDLVSEYTHRYPFGVISKLLGIPIDDEKQVMEWVYGVLRFPWEPDKALQARRDLDAYLTPILEERRANPKEDVISRLVTAELEGHKLSNEEIFAFLRLIYPAGAETTFLTMGSMMLEVLSDRALYQRLKEHPEERVVAVEEALRRHGATPLLPRFTENAVNIGGVAIPANSQLLYGIAPASHDPEEFDDPNSFSLERRPNRHLAFGKGVHFCLGSHLAREELRVSLTLLLDRLPGLRRAADDDAAIVGAPLRGVHKMIVEYDDVLPAIAYESQRIAL